MPPTDVGLATVVVWLVVVGADFNDDRSLLLLLLSLVELAGARYCTMISEGIVCLMLTFAFGSGDCDGSDGSGAYVVVCNSWKNDNGLSVVCCWLFGGDDEAKFDENCLLPAGLEVSSCWLVVVT